MRQKGVFSTDMTESFESALAKTRREVFLEGVHDGMPIALGYFVVSFTLGIAARYGTANIKAFEEIPWTASQAAVMRAQRDATVAIEQIPGNYYIARNLSFAFRAVVYNNANSRSTLYRYNIEINKELARKQKEFSY